MTTFDGKSNEQLEALIATCWKSINGVLDRFRDRSDMQAEVKRLMHVDNIMSEVSNLCDESPDLAWLILQAGLAALVNTHGVQRIDAELCRHGSEGN